MIEIGYDEKGQLIISCSSCTWEHVQIALSQFRNAEEKYKGSGLCVYSLKFVKE